MKKMMGMVALLTAAVAGNSWAQGARTLDLAPQPLAEALQGLAGQTGIQILFDAAELQSARSRGLQGSLTPEAALQKLLQDTDFVFHSTAPGSYVIQRRPRNSQTLPEVVVRAARPSAQSEGTGTYAAAAATVAGKIPLTMREIPHSVSVVTRQQMDDQGMVNLWDALNQTTGVTAVPNDSTQSQYNARGYGLGVMYDGVPAAGALSGYQQFDLPIYDRVEVLRGPAGLLQGSDNPSGAVNLVRKRGQDTFKSDLKVSLGSWNNRRTEVDITGPFDTEKRIRGRLVVSQQDREFFYARTTDSKSLVYGNLDVDLSSATTLSVFLTVQDAETHVPTSGLPAYSNGQYLNVPRSTNVLPDWNRTTWHTEELAASLEHRLENQWTAKATAYRRNQSQFFKDSYVTGGVNPLTNKASYARREADYDYYRDGVDAFLSGPFDLLGRRHQALVGVNYDRLRTSYARGTASTVNGVSIFDPNSIPEPTVNYTLGGESVSYQHGTYGQLRLSLADPLTMIVGGRYTDYFYKSRSTAPSVPTAWQPGATARREFTPYGALIYDVTPQASLYASYSDIFIPQTNKRYDGTVIEPRVGKQHEIGAKGEFMDGKVNANIAIFQIRDVNRSFEDPDHPTFYLAAGEVESKGWETEVTGKVAKGLDLTAGYTNLQTKYLKDKTNTGKAFSNWYPRHTLKLWANYRFADDAGAGWNVGAGLVGSSRYKGNGTLDTMAQGGYAVVNAAIGYRFNKSYVLSLNAYNLFDRVYHSSGVRSVNSYNGYGDPRNFMLTFQASY